MSKTSKFDIDMTTGYVIDDTISAPLIIQPSADPAPENEGLPTSAPTPDSTKKKTKTSPGVQTSLYIPDPIYAQIKAISTKENVTIKSILTKGLEMFIDAYKAKFGPIPKKNQPRVKGSVEKLGL